jgi:tetratricopeptide (TPR) repeat protein
MKRKTLTLCIIAKDEEASIGQTIKSALAVVDEIVVGDTGSSDNTRLIAEGYGARVVDVPWEDDFAAARNAVLNESGSDWILFLDADERLQPVRPIEMQRLLDDGDVAGYRVEIVESGEDGDRRDSVRLFRNHPYVRFCYPVHETIEIALENWAVSRALVVAPSPLTVMHEGGESARHSGRTQRNRRLLREATREYPYEPFFSYQLATETLTTLEEEVLPTAGIQKTVEQLRHSWRILRAREVPHPDDGDYGPRLAGLLSACLLSVLETQEALDVVREAAQRYPESLLLRFRRAVATSVHLRADRKVPLPLVTTMSLIKQARTDLQACSSAQDVNVRQEFVWSHVHALRLQAELDLIENKIDNAERKLDLVLSDDPLCSLAWRGKGDCELGRGELRRALGYYLRAVTTDENNLAAWLRGSSVLAELGYRDNAKSWRDKAESRFPEHPGFGNAEDWLSGLVPAGRGASR